jgi:hypothetical protein
MEALHPEHDVLFSSSEVEAMKRPDPTGFVSQPPRKREAKPRSSREAINPGIKPEDILQPENAISSRGFASGTRLSCPHTLRRNVKTRFGDAQKCTMLGA